MTPNQPNSSTHDALRYAIVGMGGFAASHHEAVLALEAKGLVRLVATCDPNAEQFSQQAEQWKLQQRGVRTYSTYETMLTAHAHELDAVTLATPIPLHAPMHALAVEYGVPVYLEKPPTLDPHELEAMVQKDANTRKETLVGFNFIAEQTRIALKERLVSGEFGRVLAVSLNGKRSRNSAYFQRNNWAGRLSNAQGHLILDSCFGNSAAHYVHNVLFWAGTSEIYHWAEPLDVRAQLYRAYPINGADTFFVSATTATGVSIRIGMTHACRDIDLMRETVHTERATITCVIGSHYEIAWHNGATERIDLPEQALHDLVQSTYLAHHQYLTGQTTRPCTRLADCRPFVHLNALSYIASDGISTFATEIIDHIASATESGSTAEQTSVTQLDVIGLSEAIDAFADSGSWPQLTTITAPQPECSKQQAGSGKNVDSLSTLISVVRRIEAENLANQTSATPR